MQAKMKINAVLILGLAVLFYWFFMYCKHNAPLAAINPFADDPYDAVGSFGIQAAAFLGILSVVRAFRASSPASALEDKGVLVARAELAAVLSVGVTLAADVAAMVRHFTLWRGTAAGNELLALLCGMMLLTFIIGAGVQQQARTEIPQGAASAKNKALAVSAIMLFILLSYPESWRHGLIGVLLTALVGTVLLFVPLAAWQMALAPGEVAKKRSGDDIVGSNSRRKYQWAIVVLAGVAIGLFFVMGEASEGSGIPRGRLALVISAYIGLETAGVLIGYALLRKPLGLFRRDLR